MRARPKQSVKTKTRYDVSQFFLHSRKLLLMARFSHERAFENALE
jgi:hypothetical protein